MLLCTRKERKRNSLSWSRIGCWPDKGCLCSPLSVRTALIESNCLSTSLPVHWQRSTARVRHRLSLVTDFFYTCVFSLLAYLRSMKFVLYGHKPSVKRKRILKVGERSDVVGSPEPFLSLSSLRRRTLAWKVFWKAWELRGLDPRQNDLKAWMPSVSIRLRTPEISHLCFERATVSFDLWRLIPESSVP